ncbi:hypothetical protein AB9H28_24470, partial [Salmonella enterica subsp. enterica serovar Kentucky]
CRLALYADERILAGAFVTRTERSSGLATLFAEVSRTGLDEFSPDGDA